MRACITARDYNISFHVIRAKNTLNRHRMSRTARNKEDAYQHGDLRMAIHFELVWRGRKSVIIYYLSTTLEFSLKPLKTWVRFVTPVWLQTNCISNSRDVIPLNLRECVFKMLTPTNVVEIRTDYLNYLIVFIVLKFRRDSSVGLASSVSNLRQCVGLSMIIRVI
jgi:hypothetical protein